MTSNLNKEAIDQAVEWFADGRKVALATVIRTWGSAPVPVGSHLIVDSDGEFEGSVSGGCVEGAVVEVASEVIQSGHSRLISFAVADDLAWEVGLSCGGEIDIFVEKIS